MGAGGRDVCLDDLPKLKYLTAVMKESMRMQPVVSVMGRSVAGGRMAEAMHGIFDDASQMWVGAAKGGVIAWQRSKWKALSCREQQVGFMKEKY
jgi:hypothetical protein